MNALRKLIAPILLLTAIVPYGALAAAPKFNPSLIIHDGDLKNHTTMSAADIQAFLDVHGGLLNELRFPDRDGVERSAAQIIARAATSAKINPQVMLVLLQKEQSLIENSTPTVKALDWALGYGVCDSCAMDDPALRKFRGFSAQIYGASKRLREYMDHPEKFAWIRRGKPTTISGINIIPATEATRALYLYTPHLSSARTFWNIWNNYFGTPYPDGTVLHEQGTDFVWRIENGTRRKFASVAVAVSMIDERFVLEVPKSVLANYPEGMPIRFANYSLVKTNKGATYLLVDGKKRIIISPAVFHQLGYNPEEVIAVKEKDLKEYPSGPIITATSDTPQGTVLEDATTGARYLVIASERHKIVSNAILNAAIPAATVTTVPSDQITKYKEGAPLYFPDGTLIARSDGVLAVISGGKRQEFASITIATTLGYSVSHVIPVSEEIWQLHRAGDTITIPPTDADPESAARLAQSALGR